MPSPAPSTPVRPRSSGSSWPGCLACERPSASGHERGEGRKARGMAYLLQHLLTERAALAPGLPAVAAGERSLSYEELDRLSNQVARALLAQGVLPGDRVGILAPKSAASVVAVFGALKAGACYVPLDPRSPAERLAAIMNDSGITVVLADRVTAGQA